MNRINGSSRPKPSPSAADILVTGWSPDPTHPGIVIDNALRVVGDKTATVTASAYSPSDGGQIFLQLRRNGTLIAGSEAIAPWTAGTMTVTWTGALADGDLLTITATTFVGGRAIAAGAYIDVSQA